MRIAGINSPNYHHNQPQKSHERQHSTSLPAEADQTGLAQPASQVTAAITSQEIQKNPQPATHQKGALMQPSANSLTSSGGNSSERVRFYTNNHALPQEVWNAYSSQGEAAPDNTSHKARAAIAEYLQTQFIEERTQFEQVLGVDEYA
jgi:hypothetical protein